MVCCVRAEVPVRVSVVSLMIVFKSTTLPEIVRLAGSIAGRHDVPIATQVTLFSKLALSLSLTTV